MNAHLGKDTTNRTSCHHDTTNRNGEHMNDFITENDLVCLNISFQKRKGKLWTHVSPKGDKSQIDYILTNKKWKNSAKNCEAYSSFEGVKSDHRIVSACFKLSLRRNKPKANRKRYDWSKLKDTDICNRYTIEVRNRFNALQEKYTEPSPNEEYENFIAAHQEATKNIIPERPKLKQRVPWETEAVMEKRNELKKAAEAKRKNATRGNIKHYNKTQKELSHTYEREQQMYVQSLL